MISACSGGDAGSCSQLRLWDPPGLSGGEKGGLRAALRGQRRVLSAAPALSPMAVLQSQPRTCRAVGLGGAVLGCSWVQCDPQPPCRPRGVRPSHLPSAGSVSCSASSAGPLAPLQDGLAVPLLPEVGLDDGGCRPVLLLGLGGFIPGQGPAACRGVLGVAGTARPESCPPQELPPAGLAAGRGCPGMGGCPDPRPQHPSGMCRPRRCRIRTTAHPEPCARSRGCTGGRVRGPVWDADAGVGCGG